MFQEFTRYLETWLMIQEVLEPLEILTLMPDIFYKTSSWTMFDALTHTISISPVINSTHLQLSTLFFLAVIFVTRMKFNTLFINSWTPENNANCKHWKTTTNVRTATSADVQLLFCQHANNSYFNNTIQIFCCYKEQNTFKKNFTFSQNTYFQFSGGYRWDYSNLFVASCKDYKRKGYKASLSWSIKNRMQ